MGVVNTSPSWIGNPVLEHGIVAFSIALIVAPFSYYSGLVARSLKLPQITGYLISGIICGPYVLGILSTESVGDLNVIEGACLSIIGLAAGAEIHLSELSRAKKQVGRCAGRASVELAHPWLSPRGAFTRFGAAGAGDNRWHMRSYMGFLLWSVRVHRIAPTQAGGARHCTHGGGGVAWGNADDGTVPCLGGRSRRSSPPTA